MKLRNLWMAEMCLWAPWIHLGLLFFRTGSSGKTAMPWHFLIQDTQRGTETPLPSAPGLSHEPLSGSSPFIGHFSNLYPGGHKICGMHRQGRRIQTVGGLGVQKHKGGMLYTLWISWETNIAAENCMLQLSSRMLYCNCLW